MCGEDTHNLPLHFLLCGEAKEAYLSILEDYNSKLKYLFRYMNMT